MVLAEELHYGRASARLHLTQPTLTRNIQNLEKALNARLVERGATAVCLTEAGELVVADARRILAIADALPHLAQQVAAGEIGTLRLAFTAMGAYAVLDDFLNYINRLFPNVRINLVEMVSEEQFEALARGDIDLALARPQVLQMLASRLVHSEEMVAAIPRSHPLAGASQPLAISRILADEYIGYSIHDQKYFHGTCATMLTMSRSPATHRVSEIPAMLSLVRANRGIAIVPKSATLLNVSGVVYQAIDPADSRRVSLHACWNPENSNPALRALVPFLDVMSPDVLAAHGDSAGPGRSLT